MSRGLATLATMAVLAVDAAAEQVDDNLYTAQTIVTGTEEPERTRGFRAGLEDVMVKLAGDVRLVENGQLHDLLEAPHSLVARFEYEDRMKDIPVHDEQGTRERPHYLRIVFDRAQIDTAMDSMKRDKWSGKRPLLAVWVGVKTVSETYVLSASGPEGYGQRGVILETAERRAIPILLPQNGGFDVSVSFKAIASGDIEKLRAKSADAEALLSGLLTANATGYWDIAWQLTWQNQTEQWSLENVTFDTALKNGLEMSGLFLSGNLPM